MDINKLMDGTEALQKEMHQMIEQIKKTDRGKKLEYQDLATIFFLMKITELKEGLANCGTGAWHKI